MHYLVPAPLMSRIAEFLEDYPCPTASRLAADLRQFVVAAPGEPAAKPPPKPRRQRPAVPPES